jgi:arylsulfatase A-like enzyme
VRGPELTLRPLPTLTPAVALVCVALPLAPLDTAMLLSTAGASVPQRLWLAAYLVGQRLLLGLLLGLLAEGFARLPRRVPSWLSLLLVFSAAFTLLSYLFQEDLENQLAWQRPLFVGVTALVPVGIVGARLLLPWHWLVRAGLALGALVLLLGNHRLLLLNYPGFHVACITLSTLAAGLALSGPRGPTAFRRVHAVAAGVVLAVVVWAVAIPAPTRISSLIVTYDALALHRFTAGLFRRDTPFVAYNPRNPYFDPARRDPIPPGPPVVARAGLIVVLVTVDALRYDAVSGKHRLKLPTLEALFAEGTRFTNAAVPAVSTTNSIVSLFSGRYYPQIKWRDESTGHKTIQIPELRGRRFPQILARDGVSTFLGATNWRFLPRYKAALGFQYTHKVIKGYPHAEETLPTLVKWVEEHKKGPAFAYTHLVDVHWPYDRGGVQGTPFEAYLREVEVLDRELGKMVDGLKRAGVWDRTVLIIGADHGEAFGEHGQQRHDGWLYQQLTHVPLVIRVPGRPPRTVQEPVSIIDLGPTILELFGLAVPGSHMGQSLVPLLRNESPKYQRPVALYSKKGQGGILFPDLVKALYVPRLRQAEVYDLKKDPEEKNNLADEPWAKERVSIVRSFFAAQEHPDTRLWR